MPSTKCAKTGLEIKAVDEIGRQGTKFMVIFHCCCNILASSVNKPLLVCLGHQCLFGYFRRTAIYVYSPTQIPHIQWENRMRSSSCLEMLKK